MSLSLREARRKRWERWQAEKEKPAVEVTRAIEALWKPIRQQYDREIHDMQQELSRRLRALIPALLLCAPILAEAQTFDPCSASPGTARALVGTVIKAQWGQPPDENIDAVTVYQNGVATHLTTLNTVASAGVCGLAGYEVVIGALKTTGTFTFELSAWNKSSLDNSAQEGPKSSPFVLTVVAPNPPTVPRNVRVGS